MKSLTPLVCENLLYTHVVGTGGIGSGMFFLLEGNRTMSRDESRPGRQLNSKDYCKQHVILHYLAVLLGAGAGAFEVYPVGKVGDDGQGWALLAEMDSVGMATKGVTATKDAATLFSVCFQYPDSTGGNITTSNGASSLLAAGEVAAFLKTFKARGRGMAVAVPEVPLEARLALLMEGRKRGWFNAAAFTSGEAAGFDALGGLSLADLICVKRDEAAALAGLDAEAAQAQDIARSCAGILLARNPSGMMIVTDGSQGTWACRAGHACFVPPPPADGLVSAAGASNALLAGTLAGLACGLPFMKEGASGRFGQTPLDSAVELGVLLASFSSTSPDTIHWGADAVSLAEYAQARGVAFSGRFAALFPQPIQSSN